MRSLLEFVLLLRLLHNHAQLCIVHSGGRGQVRHTGKRNRPKAADGCTLEDLDGERWGEPSFDSYVVRTCHALRRKPINTLTDEELRLAVGQGIGLEWLVPLMLWRLEKDPFRSGDFYEGDMLESLARVPATYWEAHPKERAILASAVLDTALSDSRLTAMGRSTLKAIDQLRAASI